MSEMLSTDEKTQRLITKLRSDLESAEWCAIQWQALADTPSEVAE